MCWSVGGGQSPTVAMKSGFQLRICAATPVSAAPAEKSPMTANRVPAPLLFADRALLALGAGRGDPVVSKLLVARRPA